MRQVTLALMRTGCVKEVWRRSKRMGSSRSLWLLGGTCVPAAAGYQITHQAVQLHPTSGVLGRQEEGIVAASLLYSWQKCWYVGGEAWDMKHFCALLSPTVTQRIHRPVLTQKSTKDCCLSLVKFPLTLRVMEWLSWKWELCMNKNLWIHPYIYKFSVAFAIVRACPNFETCVCLCVCMNACVRGRELSLPTTVLPR